MAVSKWATDNGHTHNMTVRIPLEDFKALKLRAAREDTTVSRLVQESVRMLEIVREDSYLKTLYERRKRTI